MQTQIRFQPTLFIFMGTSSGQIGWRLKKLLHQAYGEVPVLRFLWIDIDTDIDPLAKPWFSSAERIELSGFNPARVIQNIDNYPTIKEWWPGAQVPAGMLAGGGSPQQMRLVGRLGLFRMFNERNRGTAFIDKLYTEIDALHEISNRRATEEKSNDTTMYSVEESCRVVLVFSPCGGTGSALSFDIAYLCRQKLEDRNPTIISIGVLPPVIDKAIKNETHTQKQKVRANAYAWFKEDNALSETRYWNVQYPEGAPVEVPAPPFNYKFVVDIGNQAGYRLNSTEDIFNMIAQSIFMDTGSSVAGALRGFTANVAALGEYFEGKQRSFSSLAAASLVFPKERLLQYCSSRMAGELIACGLLGKPDHHRVNVSASTLLAQLRLRDTDLIADLLNTANIRMQQEPAINRADSVDAAITHIDAQENQNRLLRRSESEKIASTGESLLEERLDALEREITNLAGTFGIPYALAVLSQLLTPAPSGAIEPNEITLDGLKKRVSQQGYSDNDRVVAEKEFSNARADLRRLDDGPEDVIERMVNLRGWKKKFALFKRECLTVMSKMNDIALQTAAQKQAGTVYDQISSSAERLKASLEATVTTLGTTISDLESRATKLASPELSSSNGYEFMQEVDINFADYYKIHSTQISPSSVFQGMIPARALANLQMLIQWISIEAKSASQEYAARFFEGGLDETSLLDILKAMAEKQGRDPQRYIQEQLDKLVQYCHPFWEYDQNRGLHDMEGKSIIGIEDENHSLIPDFYRENSQYELKTTGFRDRLDVVRIQHGLPAFLIRGMNEYRVVYEKKRKDKDPLHILPDMEFAPDLFPDQNRRNRDLFAIAIAFGYIVQVGSYYYFDPDLGHKLHKINPGREYRLGQGREKAEEAFSRRNEWVRMVDEKVEAEIRKIGNEEAIEKLETIILAHLLSMSKMSGDDILRKQIEKEVAALKAKQRDLGKIGS